MGRTWEPEDWQEMDGYAVLKCLYENDARCCVDGKPWIQLLPTNVILEALEGEDIFSTQHIVVSEVKRRLEQELSKLASADVELIKLDPEADNSKRKGLFDSAKEYNDFVHKIQSDDPTWEDAFVGLIQSYYMNHCTGGSLHIVLDDGNWERHHITWCAGYACGQDDDHGNDIANLLLVMSDDQLKRIENRSDEW